MAKVSLVLVGLGVSTVAAASVGDPDRGTDLLAIGMKIEVVAGGGVDDVEYLSVVGVPELQRTDRVQPLALADQCPVGEKLEAIDLPPLRSCHYEALSQPAHYSPDFYQSDK